jgi:hypothetical protein
MIFESEWQKLYHAAVLETDWTQMPQRIAAAEAAIKAKLEEFSKNHGGSVTENQAIVSALTSLKAVRKDYEAWEKSDRSAPSATRREQNSKTLK